MVITHVLRWDEQGTEYELLNGSWPHLPVKVIFRHTPDLALYAKRH